MSYFNYAYTKDEKDTLIYTDEMDNSFFTFRPAKSSKEFNVLNFWMVANFVFAIFIILFASSVSQELFMFLILFESVLFALILIDNPTGYAIHLFYQIYMTLFFIFLLTKRASFSPVNFNFLPHDSEAEINVIFYFAMAMSIRLIASLLAMLNIYDLL
ncbi:unnamed protein product [Caenorhabditis angaria]|uniref:Uncharacterized protein n=1 Tax=Caenorhabditis angaria TaxID=860376 RepID=A0A9P1MY90_9PELO|nr:unnamed protein product [Caenorhabditis angaria]